MFELPMLVLAGLYGLLIGVMAPFAAFFGGAMAYYFLSVPY